MKTNTIKKTLFSAISLTVLATSTIIASSAKGYLEKVDGEELRYTIDDFVECANWYNSGKGFAFDFTFDASSVTSNMTNTFALVSNSGDLRLTTYKKLYFSPSGEVTADIGKVIKRGDVYTYFVMFNEFTVYTDDGATGTETVKKLHFQWADLQIEKSYAQLIDTKMYLEPQSYLRDEASDPLNGMMWMAYMPNLVTNSRYGMAIVPNEYISDLTADYTAQFKTRGLAFKETYCDPIALKSGDLLYTKYGAGYYIKASLGNIKEANYMRDFTAVPFEETVSGARKYAFNITEVKDSLYDSSYRATKAGGLSTKAATYASKVMTAIDDREAVSSTTNITGYVANNTDQIMKSMNYSSSDTTLALKAAKGEAESGQLVFKTTLTSDKKIFAAVSNLYNGDHVIENSNVEISYELYQNVATNWSATEEHTGYLSQLYPNGYETLTTGYYPDALMPMDVAVRTGSNVISPTNGQNQAFFIKVKVPNNAVSGTYTGNAIVYVADEGIMTIPVSVTISNFSIAGRSDAKTIFNISRSELSTLYGDRSKYNNLKSPFFASAVSFAKERGICGGVIPEYSGTIESLPTYVEAVKKYVTDSRVKSYLINFNQRKVTMTYTYKTSWTKSSSISYDEEVIASDSFVNEYEENRCGLKDILTALVNGSTNELNLLEGCCVYDPHADEPNADSDYLRNILNNNSLQTSIQYVLSNADFTGKDAVKAALQKVTYIVTCGPENTKFVGDYGITNLKSVTVSTTDTAASCSCGSADAIKYRNLTEYCPNIMWNCDNTTHKGGGYSWDALSKVYDGTDTTTRVWEYSCVQPVAPYPSYIINAPMIRIRSNRWRHFRLGIQGEFYYCLNRSSKRQNSTDIPLTEEQTLNGGADYEGAYGDGVLMYPVHDMYSYADRNLYWFSSLRLENISEATDDLNYLYYAKELIAASSSASSLTSSLNTIVDTMYTDKLKPFSVTTSAQTLLTARSNLTTLISGLVNN